MPPGPVVTRTTPSVSAYRTERFSAVSRLTVTPSSTALWMVVFDNVREALEELVDRRELSPRRLHREGDLRDRQTGPHVEHRLALEEREDVFERDPRLLLEFPQLLFVPCERLAELLRQRSTALERPGHERAGGHLLQQRRRERRGQPFLVAGADES